MRDDARFLFLPEDGEPPKKDGPDSVRQRQIKATIREGHGTDDMLVATGAAVLVERSIAGGGAACDAGLVTFDEPEFPTRITLTDAGVRSAERLLRGCAEC